LRRRRWKGLQEDEARVGTDEGTKGVPTKLQNDALGLDTGFLSRWRGSARRKPGEQKYK